MNGRNTDSALRSPNARERLLSAARSLFYCKGIHATGVERIAEQARVSKRTMYQQFSGKTDLVEQYLRRIDDTGGIPMEQALFTPGATHATASWQFSTAHQLTASVAAPSTTRPSRRLTKCPAFTTSCTSTSCNSSRA